MDKHRQKRTVGSIQGVVEASQALNTQRGTKKRQDNLSDKNKYRTAQFLRLVLWQEIEGSSTSRTK